MATKYIHFSEEQKNRANSVDLVDFLRSQGEEVERSGHEYRWKRHDSVTLNGNRWFRHSAEEGGHAIDFVKEFYSLSFPEAVTMLLNGESGVEFAPAQSKPERSRKPFALPEANPNARRVYAYLTKQRCVDPDIISHFVRAGTLYEDNQYHNVVFVGVDADGQPRHAHRKSTNSYGQSFRANVEGSDARYGFGHVGKSYRLYVFEAPIDLLSFLTLYKRDWRDHSYLTLNGVSDQAVVQTLADHPHLQTPILCLDNDRAGIAAVGRITEKLKELGYDNVSRLLPSFKDWNDVLQQERGVAREPQPEPELSMEVTR